MYLFWKVVFFFLGKLKQSLKVRERHRWRLGCLASNKGIMWKSISITAGMPLLLPHLGLIKSVSKGYVHAHTWSQSEDYSLMKPCGSWEKKSKYWHLSILPRKGQVTLSRGQEIYLLTNYPFTTHFSVPHF